MLGRRQELNLQFLQILDGFLLAFAFWMAHAFRFFGASWFVFDKPIESFSKFQWLIFIIIPFGPVALELEGFYGTSMRKPISRSLKEIARSAVWLGLLIAACSYF